MVYRVAIIGMGCENCTFNTSSTVLADFNPILNQEALASKYETLTQTEAGARLDLAETQFVAQDFSDAEFLYCCNYRAIPGGNR